MSDRDYIEELNKIDKRNYMYDYEDVYSDFMFAQLQQISSGDLRIIIRCDRITPELFWHIRYLRSLQVEPKYILSTYYISKEHRQILNIEIVTYSDLSKLDTSKMMLLIVNRESDFGYKTQEDYREDSFAFVLRERAKIGYFRERGVDNYFHFTTHRDEYLEVIHLLYDHESKDCFVECIRALLENDIYRKKQYSSNIKYFDSEIYLPHDNEVWINCGAATGDTILRFINNHRKCKKIYAVDIDPNMIKRLSELKGLVDKYVEYDIEVIQKNFQRGDESMDILFGNEEVTLINLDVEGAELQILESAENIIRSQQPVLAVCAYHNPGDLLKIPKYLKSIQDDYNIFLRKYKGCWPDAINEYVYYAVPRSRLCTK